MRNSRQLTREERYQSYSLRREGLSERAVAARLRRSSSTISRELVRNRGFRGYRPGRAEFFRQARRDATIRDRIGPEVRRAAVAGLAADWSPEQISGRLARSGMRVSHEWIYRRAGGQAAGRRVVAPSAKPAAAQETVRRCALRNAARRGRWGVR